MNTNAPLRKVVRRKDGADTAYEKLECGHVVWLYKRPPAKRRRCIDCVAR